jgi:hypothetical protein
MKYWEINRHCLEFDEEEHIYICDGIIVPSVSEILKSKFDDYACVSRSVLEQASARGTALHEAIEIYETTGQESDLKEFKNYLFLKKHFNIKNISNELPIIYEEDGRVLFAGQLDQIIEINGELGINDFKRVSSPNKEKIAYQVNLYKMGYEQSYQKQIKRLSFMQLREDTRKFYPLPINEETAKSLLKEFYQEN